MAHGADERKAFLEALEKTPFIALACKRVGIARATIHRWMRDDLDFKVAVKQMVRSHHDKLGEAAYSVVQEKVKDKNFTAARFVLTHYPSLYGITQLGSSTRYDARKEREEDWRNMTSEERKASVLREATKAFSDEDGNLIMSRETADYMIKEGHITEEDIVGEVPKDPNDPGRRNLTPPVPAHAVRVRNHSGD